MSKALISRRDLLRGLSAAAALAIVGFPSLSPGATEASQRDFFTPGESARRTLRQLDAPLILAAQEYRDTDFVVQLGRFRPSTVGAALYGRKGVRGAVLRNCTLRTDAQTWDPAWLSDPLLSALSGVRLDTPREFVVDGLHVEGFPNCGLAMHGVDRARIDRFIGTRCFQIADFGWVDRANRHVRIDGFRGWDTWGPGPGVIEGVGGAPSRVRPGGWIGADGIAGYFEASTLARLDFSGELFAGVKLVRSKRVYLVDVLTNHLMVQGTVGRNGNPDGSTDGSEAIVVRRLLIDKRRCAGDVSERGNGIQASWNVRGLDVREFSLLAGGSDGHTIQLWGNVVASFHGGVIEGFNGARGAAPAYAGSRSAGIQKAAAPCASRLPV